jgi:hypothetical protein
VALIVGTWGPEEEGDSNVHFTIARHGRGLRVTAVDVFDGEKLRVRGVAWNGSALRFETVTPSTGATMTHELRALASGRALYRFTVAQRWKKLPEGSAGSERWVAGSGHL